jgi:hypothetical protein
MNQNKKNEKKIFAIMLIFLVLFGFLTQLIIADFSLNNLPIIGKYFVKLSCEKKGGEYIEQLSVYPYGCFKKFTDEGKRCVLASDCQANACIIDTWDLANNKGKLTGICPGLGSFEDDYEPHCGWATIDNNKVIENRTSCIY